MPIPFAEKQRLLALMMADPDLSATAKNVAWALLDCHNSATGQCFPSVAYLAEKVGGKGRRAVTEALAKLIASGWVRQTRRRGTALYEFAFDRARGPAGDPQPEPERPRDGARESAHQQRETARDDARNTARLDGRKTAHGTSYLEPISPLPPTEPAAGASRRVFVERTDKRWSDLDKRWRREKNPRGAPVQTLADYGNARGWLFPADWLADLQRQDLRAMAGGRQ